MEMGGHRPNQTDVAVGQRIRTFRKEANLSQTALADQIGVTFQQLQKYENGTNRVGAGRLMLIARALNVPITAFFDGLARPTDKRRRAMTARLAELNAVPAAPKLLAAFSKISDNVLEADVLNLVRALSGSRGRH
jgi:transcriptional regulator with XRE-family HTH domain